MLDTAPSEVLSLLRHQVRYYPCYATKCIPIKFVHYACYGAKWGTILVMPPNVVLPLLRHQMRYYACYSAKWGTMLDTAPNEVLCFLRRKMRYYLCYGAKWGTMLVTAPNEVLSSLRHQMRFYACYGAKWVLSLLQHQMRYYLCYGVKWGTMLVTVLNEVLCLSQYRMWRVQHHGTVSNINRCFPSSNTRQSSRSRYEGVYCFQGLQRERERERELVKDLMNRDTLAAIQNHPPPVVAPKRSVTDSTRLDSPLSVGFNISTHMWQLPSQLFNRLIFQNRSFLNILKLTTRCIR